MHISFQFCVGSLPAIIPHQQPRTTFNNISVTKMKRLEHFTRHVDFSIKDKDYLELDKYIPNTFNSLTFLEKISIHNGIPVAEYLMTYLHESQLPSHKYIAINKLLNAFRDKYNLNITNKNKNKIYETLINYIYEYPRLIGHKLPSHTEQNTFTPINDNLELVLPYIMGINQSIYRFTQNITSRTPIQLDIFFIAPNQSTSQSKLPFDARIYAQSDPESRNHSNEEKKMDSIAHIKSLLSDALVHAQPGDRYIIITNRRNINNLHNDITYIWKCNQSLPAYFITNHSELVFLCNAKRTHNIIQNVLQCTDNNTNILGLHYHLHSCDINKIYVSYGPFKQRITTQENMLSKLMILFNNINISDRIRDEFMINYRILRDVKYKYGKYWFSINFNNDNNITQPTELRLDELIHKPIMEQHNELLIRFVAVEPTNIPIDIISQVPTNQPTLIPFNFNNATFTELITYDNYNTLEISHANVDQKCDDNDEKELKSAHIDEQLSVPWDDSDDDNDNEYNKELQRMIRQFNQMNNEMHNLEALNINEIKEMDEIDNAIQEIENMQENMNDISNNVDTLNDNQ